MKPRSSMRGAGKFDVGSEGWVLILCSGLKFFESCTVQALGQRLLASVFGMRIEAILWQGCAVEVCHGESSFRQRRLQIQGIRGIQLAAQLLAIETRSQKSGWQVTIRGQNTKLS